MPYGPAEVGVGPWAGPVARGPAATTRSCSREGDRRNVVDRYRYWTVEAIVADLDTRRHDFHVAIENWRHDFNIGTIVRTANAFLAAEVHIVGNRRWNRRGAMVTDRYQHVRHHPTADDLAAYLHERRRAPARHRQPARLGAPGDDGGCRAGSASCSARRGRGSRRRPARPATARSRSPSSAPPARSTPLPPPRSRCTPGSGARRPERRGRLAGLGLFPTQFALEVDARGRVEAEDQREGENDEPGPGGDTQVYRVCHDSSGENSDRPRTKPSSSHADQPRLPRRTRFSPRAAVRFGLKPKSESRPQGRRARARRRAGSRQRGRAAVGRRTPAEPPRLSPRTRRRSGRARRRAPGRRGSGRPGQRRCRWPRSRPRAAVRVATNNGVKTLPSTGAMFSTTLFFASDQPRCHDDRTDRAAGQQPLGHEDLGVDPGGLEAADGEADEDAAPECEQGHVDHPLAGEAA